MRDKNMGPNAFGTPNPKSLVSEVQCRSQVRVNMKGPGESSDKPSSVQLRLRCKAK